MYISRTCDQFLNQVPGQPQLHPRNMTAQRNYEKTTSNQVYHKMWKTFDERTAQGYAAHLLPHLKPNSRVLDVGCGRGSITRDLACLVPQSGVLGIDINATLIDAAKSRATERHIRNIDFMVMDANALETMPSASFDVIHEHQVLFHLPDPVPILKELHRILKPGGILSMRDNASLHHYPELPMMQRYIRLSMEHTNANKEGIGFGLWNHSAAQEAGFAKGRIECSSWGWSWKDPQTFVDFAKNSARQILLAKGAMSEAELDQAEKEWEEWASTPQARLQGLEGAVLCWKED